MHIDHIGIAVSDLEATIKTYETILNTTCSKREIVISEKVETAFFQTGESKVELLGATSEDSVIAKYLKKKGQGLHHVAFEVDNIYSELERLENEGFTILNEQPKHGADNKLVAFIHPKSCQGILVELCQEIKNNE